MDGGTYVENRKRKLSLESLSSVDPLDRSRTSVLSLLLRKEYVEDRGDGMDG